MKDVFNTPEFKEQYRERFKRLISKKIDTVMIFPLSQFEAAFGFLWGLGKKDEQLTKEEKDARVKWQQCRNAILNLGNAQKRNAMQECELWDLTLRKQQVTFLPINKYREMTSEQIEQIEQVGQVDNEQADGNRIEREENFEDLCG